MKPQWIALPILLFLSGVFAGPAFSPGLGLGVNFADQSITDSTGNSAEDMEARTTFITNAVFEMGLTQTFSIVPGFGFAMRGGEQNQTGFDRTIRIDYLIFPLWLKGRYLMGRVMPYAAVGPNLGVRLSAESETQVISSTVNFQETTDLGDLTRSIDIGADFLAGADYDANPLIPFVQAGYYLGFLNVLENPTGEAAWRNRGFYVQAGMRYNLTGTAIPQIIAP